jgi:hypothetical protein
VTVGHNPPVLVSPRCCIWLSRPGFQDLDKRTLGFTLKTWVLKPRYLALRTWVSGPRYLALKTWVSEPRYLALKTWVSEPRYLALKTWVSGPRQTHRYRTPKALHPTVVLSFSRHFFLRPVVTDGQTHTTSDFIYKITFSIKNINTFHIVGR